MRGIWILLLLGFCGCSHWIAESETRLQLDNRTPWAVRRLCVVGDGVPDVIWIVDSVAPQSKSRVYRGEWVGLFRWALEIRDSSCGMAWCRRELGELAVPGGSVLWRLKIRDRDLVVEAK